MPKIIWKGNMNWDTVIDNSQEWAIDIKNNYVPDNANSLNIPENIFQGLTPYFIFSGLLCFIVVFIKRKISATVFIDFHFLPLSFILGFIVALPLHELCHAIFYPKEAKVYIGICLKQVRAFCVSASKLKRNNFILMSLAPAFLGLLFLIIFLITPLSLKWLITISMISMFMGLISPVPDYRITLLLLRQVPKDAYIQPTDKGYIWYRPPTKKED